MKEDRLTTPCYVIHQEKLEQGITLLKDALAANWNRHILGYSFKTNALPWALMQMKGAGFYAEVVSEDEYDLARYLGFSHVIYNGPLKSRTSFLDALERGHIINLDAERELDWLEESGLKEGTVGLRVNFDLEALCPGETSPGGAGGRFGFSYETGALERAIKRLAQMGITHPGLHLHASSKTRSIAIYRALARMAVKLKAEYHLQPAYIDIGGGYFGGMENRPQFPDYMRAIREELEAAYSPEETILIVEPGTSLITPPIEYRAAVVDCKDTYAGRFVVTDGSRIDVDPLHGKSSYFHNIVYGKDALPPQERATLPAQVICGFTCMEDDRLFALRDAPELRPGDVVAFEKVGGYTMCLTPLFIRYFPRVYVERDGAYTCVRERWTVQEYVQKSRFRDSF